MCQPTLLLSEGLLARADTKSCFSRVLSCCPALHPHVGVRDSGIWRDLRYSKVESLLSLLQMHPLDNVKFRDSLKEKLLVKIGKQGTSCGFSRRSNCFLS